MAAPGLTNLAEIVNSTKAPLGLALTKTPRAPVGEFLKLPGYPKTQNLPVVQKHLGTFGASQHQKPPTIRKLPVVQRHLRG